MHLLQTYILLFIEGINFNIDTNKLLPISDIKSPEYFDKSFQSSEKATGYTCCDSIGTKQMTDELIVI
jgi:hypothetical protein